jgi:uncharacterized delta-60 repeat protein
MGNKAIIHFPNKVFSSRTIWPIILFLAFFIITSLPQDVHSASADVGTLDNNFVPSVKGDYVITMAVQDDNKILVGGLFNEINGKQRNNIARLNANGTLDDFNPKIEDGEVITIALQSDGKILIGGSFKKINNQERLGLARLNANGSLDTNFHPNFYGGINKIAVQADGKIIVGAQGGLVRLNANGTEDATLGTGQVINVVIQDNGKILISGLFGILRLNSDGSLDESFDPDVRSGTGPGGITPIAVQNDGKILVGGFFDKINGQNVENMARLNPDGSLDSTFKPNVNNLVVALAIQKDGKILAGGYFNKVEGQERIGLARINPDGSVNPFKADIDIGLDSGVFSLVPQPDGKILVGGAFTSIKGLTRNNIARLNFQEVKVLPGVLMLLLDD